MFIEHLWEPCTALNIGNKKIDNKYPYSQEAHGKVDMCAVRVVDNFSVVQVLWEEPRCSGGAERERKAIRQSPSPPPPGSCPLCNMNTRPGLTSLTLHTWRVLFILILATLWDHSPLVSSNHQQPILISILVNFETYHCACTQSLSQVWLFVSPWTVTCQGPLSMEFSGKKTGVCYHFLLQGIFLKQRLNCHS